MFHLLEERGNFHSVVIILHSNTRNISKYNILFHENRKYLTHQVQLHLNSVGRCPLSEVYLLTFLHSFFLPFFFCSVLLYFYHILFLYVSSFLSSSLSSSFFSSFFLSFLPSFHIRQAWKMSTTRTV